MTETVNEKVDVITIFKRGINKNDVLPYKIKWQAREYIVKSVSLHHPLRDGRKLWHVFFVTDGNMDFKLKLDTETLHWTLEEVTDGLPN